MEANAKLVLLDHTHGNSVVFRGFGLDLFFFGRSLLQQAYSRLDFTDHIVLLGWTDITIFVLEELQCMLAGHGSLSDDAPRSPYTNV